MYDTDVFISYKREEKSFALELKARLAKKKYKVWMDQNIAYGEKWRAAIDKHLENTILLVLITSPESMRSAYITYEWSYACLALGKDFHWIQIADCDKDKGMFGLLMDSRNAPLVVSGSSPTATEWKTIIKSIEDRLANIKKIREAGEILADEHKGYLAPSAAEELGKVSNPFHIPLARQMLLKGLKTHTRTSGAVSGPIVRALSKMGDLSAIPYLITFLETKHETEIDDEARALLHKLIAQYS